MNTPKLIFSTAAAVTRNIPMTLGTVKFLLVSGSFIAVAVAVASTGVSFYMSVLSTALAFGIARLMYVVHTETTPYNIADADPARWEEIQTRAAEARAGAPARATEGDD